MHTLKETLLSAARQAAARNRQDEAPYDEETKYVRKRFKDPKWTLDRGAGYYQQERLKRKLPSLLTTGRWGHEPLCLQRSITWERRPRRSPRARDPDLLNASRREP